MTTRAELRQITHDKVTTAAEQLFREHGFTATTVRDIAAAAGVSVGSVMAIGDKRALLVSLFDRAIADVHRRRSSSNAPPPTGGNVVDHVVELISPFLDVFAADVELAREYGAVLMSGNHGSTVFHGLGEMLVRDIETILRADGMNEADTPRAARTIYMSYLGAIFAWAASGTPDASESLETFRSIVSFTTQPRGD